MNDGFRQRLVGAIVLACVTLILWPIIFSDVSNLIVDRRSQIPPLPAFEKYSTPQPTRPTNIDPVVDYSTEMANIERRSNQSRENTPQEGIAIERVENTEKPILDQRGLPVSWVIQVASFTKKHNADEVKLALQEKGFKAYAREVTTSEGLSTRVFVGPKLTKKALKNDQKKIDKMFSLESIIVPFVP
ncbi:MAG: DedD protein [Oceanicoccus sp.]|jgi:DedD protein